MIHHWPTLDRSLLATAREANGTGQSALGELLERCRGYLLLVAAAQLSARIRSKVAPSDLVQQTFLEARRDFDRFDGDSPEAFVGWLRQVLEHNIADAHRQYERTQQRSVDREEALPANSSWNGEAQLIDSRPTPQAGALSREEQARLDGAIASLPELAQHVIHLRYAEELPFDEIGRRIGKSGEAARKIWSRTIVTLQKRLKE